MADRGKHSKAQTGHSGTARRARFSQRSSKRERASMSLGMRFLIAALIVGVIGAAAFFLGRHINGAWAARDAINEAIAQVGEADEGIVALNDAVSATVDEATGEAVTELTNNAEEALSALTKADDRLARANELDEFLDDNQRLICKALRDSIDARRSMVSLGEEIIAVDARVGEARSYLEQAIEKALEANNKSQEATQAANEYAQYLTGDESVSTKDANVTVELDNSVVELLEEARSALASAKETFPEADYSLYETYLEKRALAATTMLEADTALISGDFNSVSEKTTAYNEADAAATEAAAALPASTSSVFEEPYTTLTGATCEAYAQAANKAAEADALIRHYQGVNVSTLAASTEAATSDATTATTAESSTDKVAITDEALTSGSAEAVEDKTADNTTSSTSEADAKSSDDTQDASTPIVSDN